jgi:hypothetical protein
MELRAAGSIPSSAGIPGVQRMPPLDSDSLIIAVCVWKDDGRIAVTMIATSNVLVTQRIAKETLSALGKSSKIISQGFRK